MTVHYIIIYPISSLKINSYIDEIIGVYQCGFRPNRSTMSRFLHLSDIGERINVIAHSLFIDFKKVCDLVRREFFTVFSNVFK
jgi:hypothetical protein